MVLHPRVPVVAGTPHALPEVEERGGDPAQCLGDPPLLVGVRGAPRGGHGHGEERDAEQRLPRQPVHLDGEANPAREQAEAQCCQQPPHTPQDAKKEPKTPPTLLAAGVPRAPSTAPRPHVMGKPPPGSGPAGCFCALGR